VVCDCHNEDLIERERVNDVVAESEHLFAADTPANAWSDLVVLNKPLACKLEGIDETNASAFETRGRIEQLLISGVVQSYAH
jgi:hypothetical protein